MGCAIEDANCAGSDGGRSFYFKVNGEEVYMSGANMVPMDYYPSRMYADEELDWMMESAIAANINVLRIWGGGMYLSDSFYSKADEHGLMIWHDLMFSCKIYPMHSEEFV